MKKFLSFKGLILLFVVAGLSSCATIFNGSRKQIVFDSNQNLGKPLSLVIDGEQQSNVTFPYTAKVKRGFSQSVATAQAEGYKPATVTIDKKFNPVTLLNLINGGILGLGIDAITGAMTKPVDTRYIFDFEKQ